MSNPRVYVAGKFGRAEADIQEVLKHLRVMGYEVIYDWTKDDRPRKPYLDNVETNRPVAEQMREAARNCELLIVYLGDDLLGAVIEFGIALGCTWELTDKLLVLIGRDFRQSIFYTLPEVSIVEDIPSALEEAKSFRAKLLLEGRL